MPALRFQLPMIMLHHSRCVLPHTAECRCTRGRASNICQPRRHACSAQASHSCQEPPFCQAVNPTTQGISSHWSTPMTAAFFRPALNFFVFLSSRACWHPTEHAFDLFVCGQKNTPHSEHARWPITLSVLWPESRHGTSSDTSYGGILFRAPPVIWRSRFVSDGPHKLLRVLLFVNVFV